ncbi:MAG: hypothetical protein ACOYKE_01645 [Ferruginibacter sp.]
MNASFRILIGVILMVQMWPLKAQLRSGTKFYDSILIPKPRLPQQFDFLNGTYDFPSKPRNFLEVGISPGMITISGDVPSVVPTFGFEAHIRKSIGYTLSIRAQYVNAVAKGLHWLSVVNHAANPAWGSYLPPGSRYNAPLRNNDGIVVGSVSGDTVSAYDKVFFNYRSAVQDLGIQAIATLNNLRFHKSKIGLSVYGGAGLGFTWYNVRVNALDANGKPYISLFNSLTSATHPTRAAVTNALRNGMDNTYETPADGHRDTKPRVGKNTIKPSGTVLFGMGYKLSQRVNIFLEDRHTFVKDDLLDGQRWQVHPWGDVVLTREYDSWNFFSIGLNYNFGSKAVEPLYWINPKDYVYGYLNVYDKPAGVIQSKLCDDPDGDGICLTVDLEPNTPAGCPVDQHGVSLDTDGDGVPDCKDKQLITPTDCFPVDADGIGKCPDPPKCCEVIEKPKPTSCNCTPMEWIYSGKGTPEIDQTLMAQINSVVDNLKANPTCKVYINFYGTTTKSSANVMMKFADKLITRFVEIGGIDRDRIQLEYSTKVTLKQGFTMWCQSAE